MIDTDTLTLMTAKRVQRTLERMAHEINEQNRSNNPVLLFGIDQRGYVVARQLAEMLSNILRADIEARQFLVKEGSEENKQWSPEEADKKYFIVIVDDVIFSGHTMFRALKAIDELLKPSEMHTAVLIDRGHRKYPIKAEFCGMELPTKLDEHVTVVTDEDHVQQVRLFHQ
ncbi:phosphoribosyltransferase family protein [Fodinibius salsisoli]|uniref:Phosphoribosyltransferase domain-containing protein n=1 Tax=Fodinibius salsisoli TaxID=2820877 RepID=A0ABT3PRR7_9BACT|nr:phosphoribosyltransferase family protein [Fodinibius salsisoli]MCW9708559.1 hypothetical protein [Fodinibius salsisoli]